MLKFSILALVVIAGLGVDAAQAGHFKLSGATGPIDVSFKGQHCATDMYFDTQLNRCEVPDPSPPPYDCMLPNGTHPTDCYAPGHTVECSGGHKTNNGTMTSCQ